MANDHQLAQRLRVVLRARSDDPNSVDFLDDPSSVGEFIYAIAAGLEAAVLLGVRVPLSLLDETDQGCGAHAAKYPHLSIDDIPESILL